MTPPAPSGFGVLYFLDDNPRFREMQQISAASLRRFHPDWPVHVVTQSSAPVSPLRALYRRLSFWKRAERTRRAHQDHRTVCAKTAVYAQSPFAQTLYIDADTVVLRPLDDLRQQIATCDVIAAPSPGKHYQALAPWQPAEFPLLNAGVFLYSRRFVDVFEGYVARTRHTLGRRHDDQFVFSLTCALERAALRIQRDPELQLDTMNLDAALGRSDYPRDGDTVDLAWEGLRRFRILHYNGAHKDAYLRKLRHHAAQA
jgi:hypothetical protein